MPNESAGTVLVKDGVARAVIVPGDAAPEVARVAAQDFQWHIEQASGVRLPIVMTEKAEQTPAETARVVVGGGLGGKTGDSCTGVAFRGICPQDERADDRACRQGRTPKTRAKSIVRDASSATQFAVAHVLDHYLGVRWLWPGAVGTYVPKRSTIILPPMDTTARPDLVERSFMVALPRYRDEASTPKDVFNRMLQETGRWCAHHQLGDRGELQFGHAFTRWWEKYHNEHPDYFAVPPAGTPQVSTKAVKLCTSNPAVIDQILAEWNAAGMPAVWNVCPNDGIGFCTCSRCRALDPGGPYSPEDVWTGKVNLTARHVVFYNALLPACATQPQRNALQLRLLSIPKSALGPAHRKGPGSGICPRLFRPAGMAGLECRWCRTGLAPQLASFGSDRSLPAAAPSSGNSCVSRTNGMLMYRFDSLHGYWATQGPNYYLIARLGARPELTVDDIVNEYASAFGAAGAGNSPLARILAGLFHETGNHVGGWRRGEHRHQWVV